MRIIEASLCLRFYRSDGWTREAVRELLSDDKRLSRVSPRYFDDRDRVGLEDDLPHDDCDYFAVYDCADPFSKDAIAKHELIPFGLE